MHTFASVRSTPFIEIDDKGGEIVQRYESFEIEIVQGGEIRYKNSKKQRLDMDMDKEGATLKKRDEIVDMKALGEIETKKQRLDMDMDKEGATLKKRDGSKFLDKRSTQVGGASS